MAKSSRDNSAGRPENRLSGRRTGVAIALHPFADEPPLDGSGTSMETIPTWPPKLCEQGHVRLITRKARNGISSHSNPLAGVANGRAREGHIKIRIGYGLLPICKERRARSSPRNSFHRLSTPRPRDHHG